MMLVKPKTKRKVFISFYHKDDEKYKVALEKILGDSVISKSVEDGDIDDDLSAAYIKRLIQDGYISDSSVMIVLVGKKTYGRKHVDWEISAALSKKVGGYSGIFGLCLPSHDAYKKENYSSTTIPPRLGDNLETGFAHLYDWTTDKETLLKYIEAAFERKNNKSDLINNSRSQFSNNRCS
jgi:hypothetical protein